MTTAKYQTFLILDLYSSLMLHSQVGGRSTGGNCTEAESKKHINYLEMLAIYLGQKTFASKKEQMHIRIMCDNTSAVNTSADFKSCRNQRESEWMLDEALLSGP